jgi:hypothetical protein
MSLQKILPELEQMGMTGSYNRFGFLPDGLVRSGHLAQGVVGRHPADGPQREEFGTPWKRRLFPNLRACFRGFFHK